MAKTTVYATWPQQQIALVNSGIDPREFLRKIGFPEDSFNRETISLPTCEFINLWNVLVELADSPLFPLRFGSYIGSQGQSPPYLLALFSQNLNQGLPLFSRYKKLFFPVDFVLTKNRNDTILRVMSIDEESALPGSYLLYQLVSILQLVRTASNVNIIASEVVLPGDLTPEQAYHNFFGVKVKKGLTSQIKFHAADANLPFLTANKVLLRNMELEMEKLLTTLEREPSTTQLVEATLRNMLPRGESSIDSVAKSLGTSARTLQRKLKREHQTFRALLQQTRLLLAQQYLKDTKLPGSEISFILGYEDPNCFYRAFYDWTGKTPEQSRAELQGKG